MQQQISKMHHKLGSSPLILGFLGVLALVLWLCATIVQIQTSEFLAMGSMRQVTGVELSVLSQPWVMITGQAPIQFVTAWVYAWVVELITLVFGMALTISVAKIAAVNPFIARLYPIAGTVLILLNGWADYSSSPGSNWLVQSLIAVAIGGIVVVGLPLGLGLLERAVEEYRA